eukprot:gene10373-biopygen8509
MEEAYKIAAEKSGQSMQKGRERYNERAFATELKPGDRVLVKRLLERGGPGKLRSFWENQVYVVLRRPDPHNAVYEVALAQGTGRKRMLHRNLMLPCPFLLYEATPENPAEPHHPRPASSRNQRQPNHVIESDEEGPADEYGFDPDQLSEVMRHMQHIPTEAAENGESGLPSDNEIEVPQGNEEPHNVTTNTPMAPSN